MIKTIWAMLVIVALPAAAGAMDPPELRTGIGYDYKSVADGVIGIEYALSILTDEETYWGDAASLTGSGTSKDLMVANSLRFSYDFLNRVALSAAIPYVYRKWEVAGYGGYDQSSSDIGDVSLDLKVQLTGDKSDAPVIQFLTAWHMPTGKSPYEIDPEKETATGSGTHIVELGFTFSKAMGKVMPYGRLAYLLTFEAENLDSQRYGDILTEVNPGDLFGGEVGLAGSVEKAVSVMAGIEYYYQFEDEYIYQYSGIQKNVEKKYATAKFGAGFSFGKVSVHPRFGFGITDDAPDFFFQIRVPLYLATK
ncbi:MAG: transporter [Thermodesulfobacteriota bacterium]